MMNRFIAHNMPKIELHCHLDGSVSLPLIQKLMQQEKKEPLGLEELREKLVAPMDCSSLAEYLEKFELPLGCLQTKEGLSAAAQDLALSAAKEQVKYLEVRFAPAFSMEQGLSVRGFFFFISRPFLSSSYLSVFRLHIVYSTIFVLVLIYPMYFSLVSTHICSLKHLLQKRKALRYTKTAGLFLLSFF